MAWPPPAVLLVTSIRETFSLSGLSEGDAWHKTIEYLKCADMSEVLFFRISAMLYAALARKASSGQLRMPSQGMMNDIRAISAMLPYCNAMFLDKECTALLNEQPLRTRLGSGTKVFSLNTKDEFVSFLNLIEAQAPREHLDKVREVYGDDWRKPYVTMYAHAQDS